MSKACAKKEGSVKVFDFIKKKLIQGIAELKNGRYRGLWASGFFTSC